ncbi:hypothetical protein AB6A40_003132 [Gnathostoma spinigerum]|uniref:R3H-associated N-terminal domain-containing protein n=1 Tax=Gnathostoma spinigerum TaxID=75299 RepID=A0ABD6EHI9_9BILA
MVHLLQVSKKVISHQKYLEAETCGLRAHKSMGARKWRRIEHAYSIYAMADPEDICTDFSDIFPSTITAFTKLFMDEKNMQTWYEFIEKDEEEQQRILDNELKEHGRNHDENDDQKLKSKPTDSPGTSAADDWEDSRNHHPAYTSTASFNRMDRRFKSLFLQKRLPWKFIRDSEKKLRNHFETKNDDTMWTSSHSCSPLERLLLHGLSQYLLLHSSSCLDEWGERVVRIWNMRPYFIPPHKFLVSHLSTIPSHRKILDKSSL